MADRPMTWNDAAAGAWHRWGDKARVVIRPGGRHVVGVITFLPGQDGVKELGGGATWEDAFHDADRRDLRGAGP